MMFGRKHQLLDSSEDASKFVHLDEESNGGQLESSKGKTKAEPSRGFFRRGGQYDELRDDVSGGSPSPTKSTLDGGEAPAFERDSTSSSHTQVSSILGTRRSIGFTDSIRSRLSSKDDPNSGGKKAKDDPNQGFVAAPLTGAQSSKKTSSGQVTKKRHSKKSMLSDAQTRSKSGYGAVPCDNADSIDSGSQDLSVPVPRSAFAPKEVDASAANGKHLSSGILPKLAASFGQGPRRGTESVSRADSSAMGSSDRLRTMDDSAIDSTADYESSGQASHAKPPLPAGDMNTPTPKPSRLSILNGKNPARQQHPGHISPGQTRPLLNGSETSGSPTLSPSISPSKERFHTTTSHQALSDRTSQSSYHTDPLPARRRSEQPRVGWSTERYNRRAASENAFDRDSDLHSGVRQLPDNYLDIFEPRPAAAPASSPGNLGNRSKSLESIPNMTGHEVLKALEEGALLKKKWMCGASTREATSMAKTERLIRCRLQDGKVVLHYHHKGVKGLLDKEEVTTHVQRVEIVDGPWRESECLLLHTGRGILALSAPDAATYLTWTLGLNAALSSSQQQGGKFLLSAPAHAIPRDSMFVVKASL